MKYTIEEIKKFLEPMTRFHMSAHAIQSNAIEMCRQLVGMLDDKANEKTEYRKLWHDRIDAAFNEKENRRNLTNQVLEQVLIVMSLPHIDLKLKAKFDKGMAEHGAGFDKVDFDAEIENEVLDICNYLIGKHYSTTSQLQKNES